MRARAKAGAPKRNPFGRKKGTHMLHILASLFFACACIAAIMVVAVTLDAYKGKMMAALRMQPLGRQAAPWRMPPRRPARSGSMRVVRPLGLNRAAA